MNYYTLNKPRTNKQKFIAFICGMAIGVPIFLLIFFSSKKYYEYIKKEILKNPVHHIGVVTKKRSYKGRGFDVEYFVNKEKYSFGTGVSNETYSKFKYGDEIEIIYNKLDPSQAILKIDADN